MIAISATQMHDIRILNNSLFKWCVLVKLVRYIRPTARLTKKHQMDATDHFSPSATVVEGDDDSTIEDALQQLRRGRGLLVHSVAVFSRVRLACWDVCEQVFAKGSSIVECDGAIHMPEHAGALKSGILAGQRLPKSSGKHGGHNRISDDDRTAAFEWWQRHDLTNDQVEEFADVSYATMRGWWQVDHPRPDRRGRPKGAKDSKPRRRRK